MPLLYASLDPTTRRYMVAEFDRDLAAGAVIISERLQPGAIEQYLQLLHEAIKYYDDQWLEDRTREMLVDFELRRTPSGGTTTARLPAAAARMLAEGDFNRYYMRGVCARALADGQMEVEVYRARLSVEPRPESVRLEGERISAAALLDELRSARPETLADATLGKPNSGLSVRLIPEHT